MSSSHLDPPDQQTYTKMSVGEVEAIGSHCQMAFCHQLDFLPFRCESCQGKYCLDHRSETAHSCSQAGAWAKRRAEQARTDYTPTTKPSVLTHEKQCAEVSCKTLIDTPRTQGVQCEKCNRRYCLKHRFEEDHDCKNLKPIGAVPQIEQQRERGLAALNKLKAWGASKKSSFTVPQTKSKAAAAAQVKATQDLKRTAKGDDKVPAENRVYLHVEAEKETTTSKLQNGKFFYNKEWTVGRVLDLAAKSLQVANENNRGGGEERKLRVFHVEGGRLLEFSERLGTSVQSGNTIVLLRGVGPAAPDLIQV
ncbi:AN1-type zinc finger protein TMC1 [Sphaceloma murrayae]|uniref:AN1-type zinc finger protein TMC1 n=1 Tax=Sphaceloma murrayae TaxID=2082308 RepID=A0A2K1QGI3_9PEZI|nr:AN1-type zinc finger protein TMC1 [Sphaceloma murrayae]